MSWGGTEASIVVHARQDKVHNFLLRQRVWTAEQVESMEAPVQAIQPQVFRQPILVFIFPLRRPSATARSGPAAGTYSIKALDVCHMLFHAEL